MVLEQATRVRKEWSTVCDSVMHERPQFIKRTRDKMCLSSLDTMTRILDVYKFHADQFTEADGSVTVSLIEFDIIENGKDVQEARLRLARSMKEYAEEFYQHYELYANAPNRREHVPYILKILIMDDEKKLGEEISCRDGKN